ncbi:hypothetical protein P8625_05965 [Tenacibaculum tangerinum]|uniref:Uncharacterized protein n=1 Tax=Tenacibaculum tangerinum TaxID=3038772 RepID=A0ABY8L9K7_9FLAO|nr:hypothetical protein [Tenacibaculum tangerinum]WGH76700.1 hypothetical protein P8625_05965 [Tenacibaculum tangerinum]
MEVSELFNRNESVFEHKTHTTRAILFPLILWLLFVNVDSISFWLGITLFIIDLIVLGIDAFSEKDSRKSIGGLPRWEYILHLFVNSFHFASILLVIATRIEITEFNIKINETLNNSFGQQLTKTIAVNIIPGAILMALTHLILLHPKGIQIWKFIRNRNKQSR